MQIVYSARAKKGKEKLSGKIAPILSLLEEDLRKTSGKPFGRGWTNLGPVRQLGPDAYHCHLNRSYVAVWLIDNETHACRMVYVGSHERAPY